MSKIWLIMLISAIAALLFTDPDLAVKAMTAGAHEAVDLAMSLVALYAFWLGFFALLEKLNVSNFIAKLLKPLMRFLFKDLDEETEKYITVNMSANLLGLGNAATPMGIGAITNLSRGQKFATSNMIMLTVISATSLQLLPSTVIGMRATHGSQSPASFLPASIIATVLSTVVGVALVKIISKLFPDEKYAERLERRRRKGLGKTEHKSRRKRAVGKRAAQR